MPKTSLEKRPAHTPEDKKALGAQLAKARKEAGFSLESAASSLRAEGFEIGKAAVGHWETGQNLPDALWLGRLARLYRTTSDRLLVGHGQDAPPLSAEVAEMANALEALPKRWRDWALIQIRSTIEVAQQSAEVESARTSSPVRRSGAK